MEYGFDGVELKTERLMLRPFGFRDVDDYFAYASDLKMSRHTTTPEPFTWRRAEEEVAGSIVSIGRRTANFVVVLDGTVIGDVWLDLDREAGVGTLGFAIAKEHWGKGFATEPSSAVVDCGLKSEGLAKIASRTDPRNKAARRVMGKLGMTEEGILRSHKVRRGERVDEAVYGLLAEEWNGAA